VRNQRGQVQQAATARAQQAAQAPAAGTGAFGQKLDDGGAPAAAPVNRAQRRAQEKGKR
jgi:preprotein translocase subunit SecA